MALVEHSVHDTMFGNDENKIENDTQNNAQDGSKEGTRCTKSRRRYTCGCVFFSILFTGLFALAVYLQLQAFVSGLCFRLLGVELDVCTDPLELILLLDIDNPSTVSLEVHTLRVSITKQDHNADLIEFQSSALKVEKNSNTVEAKIFIVLRDPISAELEHISANNFAFQDNYQISIYANVTFRFIADLAISWPISFTTSLKPEISTRNNSRSCGRNLTCLFSSKVDECCEMSPPQFSIDEVRFNGQTSDFLMSALNATMSMHGIALQADRMELEFVDPVDFNPFANMTFEIMTDLYNGRPTTHIIFSLFLKGDSSANLVSLFTRGSPGPQLRGKRPAAGAPGCALQRAIRNLSVASPSSEIPNMGGSEIDPWSHLSIVISDYKEIDAVTAAISFSLRNPTVRMIPCAWILARVFESLQKVSPWRKCRGHCCLPLVIHFLLFVLSLESCFFSHAVHSDRRRPSAHSPRHELPFRRWRRRRRGPGAGAGAHGLPEVWIPLPVSRGGVRGSG
jgi:hypothetical protein